MRVEVAALNELLNDALDRHQSQEVAHKADIALIKRQQEEMSKLRKLLAKKEG